MYYSNEIMNMRNQVCIDASCFLSLEKQTEFLEVLDFLEKDRNVPLEVYIPSDIYHTILLSPELKFKKLEYFLKGWIEKKKDLKFSQEEKEEYVRNTRFFLSKYNPKPASEKIGGIDKIGENSIHLHDAIDKLGEIKGKIIFETIAISSEIGARIISFGEKTISFVKKLGSKIEQGYSTYKDRIRSERRIVNRLRILLFVMTFEFVTFFLTDFQIHDLDIVNFATSQLPLGLLIIGNG